MLQLILALTVLVSCNTFAIAQDAREIDSWKSRVSIKQVATSSDHHVIHSYFNTCPESPDGRFVVYYTSQVRNGEYGQLCILERETGLEKVIATEITTEDAHRAACQQWSDDGRFVVYHNYQFGHWSVMAYELATGKTKKLAIDRQLSFGSPTSPCVPLYGCHWNPGPHRHLEMLNVKTGEIQIVLTVEDLLEEYGDWIEKKFETREVSIFFPIVSPDGKKVFFKIARPSGGSDFRSKKASYRLGKVVYDLENKTFVRLFEQWGHPAWAPDGNHLIEKGNFLIDIESGRQKRLAPSCFSNHPSMSPDGKLFVTDADVTKRMLGNPGDWAIGVGSVSQDEHVVIDIFGNTKGANSWRRNHPHPVFNSQGTRIYYNINEGSWTTLRVAEIEEK